jgi:hypothetical protein
MSQPGAPRSFVTIADVKVIAHKFWLSAAQFDVHLVSDSLPRLYRIMAHDSNNKLIGRMSAKSLAELKTMIEKRIEDRNL